MSEPRRRSTRLVGTPKVNYEEKPIELPSRPSSLKKRRDSPDHSSKRGEDDSKRFKKVKLKHDDDEDTILDDDLELVSEFKSIKNKEEDRKSRANCDATDEDATDLDDQTGDSGQRYFLNESIEVLKENRLNSQNTANDTVDEDGFLIQDDEADNPPSSPPDNHQNVLDVTDYDKFNDDDDHLATSSETAAVGETKPARKKFVKKHKPKRRSIESGKLVKYNNTNPDSQATIIIGRVAGERDDPESKDQKPTDKSPKKEMKTSFADFFKSQNISKSSPTEQPADEDRPLPTKRGRGRPRKNPPAQTTTATPKSTASIQPVKRPEVLIETDNDCEMVEIVNSKPSTTGPSDVLLDDRNSSKTCLSPIDDNTIIVLDKRDEDSSSARPDDPWTIKYRPVRADQLLDNRQASEKLKNWIHDFNANVESRKDCYSDDEDEERFESCVLVTGPTGCGKTAMVYAIAEELNYKVFEINCSSRRNSRFINQIKEATLSHTVARQGDSSSSHLFSSNSNSKSKLSSKNAPPPPTDSKQKTLFSFFQKKPVPAVQAPLIDESSFSQETVNNLKALSINSNSLILFDDVDVIFEEDGGFWQALSSLIENTKRPIILTATSQIENIRQEIKTALRVSMNYPAGSALTDRLKEVVMSECYPAGEAVSISAEHVRRIESITKDYHCDIRGCLNRLQFDFSSVSISDQSAADDRSTSPGDRPDLSDEQQEETIDLQAYQSLILSDLLSSSHFQTNSRNQLDNSFDYEETYQSQDLRECILDEFIRLDSLPTNGARLVGQLARSPEKCRRAADSDSNWSDGFEQCAFEVEDCLVLVSEHSPLYCDYLPYLSSFMGSEEARFQLFVEHTRRARRFLHYLDQNNFHLSDFVKQFLKDHYLKP